ncbi:hypothetical protein TNCT_207511 [Trichonephila clavata]|uniref:Uncharacterized protein n=1 Tax=Trichonephila clavata TaxID=2740835 RepID=A0A8X6LT35_TRICU|nr:hypothetical protein TNCT_207511 [Trichonephila clavata]
MTFPDSPKKYEIVKGDVEEEEFIRPGTSHDPDFEPEYLNEPHRLNEAELSNLNSFKSEHFIHVTQVGLYNVIDIF